MDEMSKYPNLDTTEGIIRLLSHNVLEAINATPEERWKDIDPVKLIGQATALTRAAAYKNKIDIESKELLDRGFDYVKDMIFDTMAQENPQLYRQLEKYLNQKQREAKQ